MCPHTRRKKEASLNVVGSGQPIVPSVEYGPRPQGYAVVSPPTNSASGVAPLQIKCQVSASLIDPHVALQSQASASRSRASACLGLANANDDDL
eukprot:scaffold137215_cov31-Tisochrysis_lutea.AAC.1